MGFQNLTNALSNEDRAKVLQTIGLNAIDTLHNDMVQSVSDAQGHATDSQLKKWEAEARKMTAESYATEPVDTFVKVYTSNGDGTFTPTNTTDYSALHWKTKSNDSATASANSATASANSANTAGNHATDAGNSASASANSATTAGNHATDALNALDAFDDRYLGDKPGDPTLDNDGNPLAEGALYWNTTSKVMKTYNGTSWQEWSIGVTVDTVQTITGEKTFTVSPIVPTVGYGDSSAKIASTAFVNNAINPEITYISPTGHNNLMVVIGGKLYTTSGDSATNANSGTGRGLDATHFEYGVPNLREVTFPDLPAGVSIVDVGGNGYSINYALFDNGWLYTWGQNNYGVCGLGHTTAVGIPTLAVTDCTKIWSSVDRYNSYQVSYQSFIIQKTDGYVYGAGYNAHGHFGLGTTTNYSSFVQLTWIGQNPKFVDNGSGYGGSLMAQKSDGTIWTCGQGTQGKLFDGGTTTRTSPVEVTANIGGGTAGDVVYWHSEYGYQNSTSTYVAASSIVMRKTTGGVTSIYTVGDNGFGQIGNGTQTDTTTPYAVPNMSDVADIDNIGGAVALRRVLKTDGKLYVWGYNSLGQAGNGTTNAVTSPTLISSGVERLLSKNLGSQHTGYNAISLIRKTDGATYGCGYNASYHLGLGDTTNRTTYTQISMLPINDPVKMSGGFTTSTSGRISVAVTESNNMYMWGFNSQYGCHPHNANHVRYPEKVTLEGGIR